MQGVYDKSCVVACNLTHSGILNHFVVCLSFIVKMTAKHTSQMKCFRYTLHRNDVEMCTHANGRKDVLGMCEHEKERGRERFGKKGRLSYINISLNFREIL